MIALRFRGKNFVLGVLMLIILTLSFLAILFVKNTENLLKSFEEVRKEGRVYISPGAYGGIYQTSERYQDVKFFAKWVVQQLHMYNEDKFLEQYLMVQPFFSSELLVTADNHYSDLVVESGMRRSYISIDHDQVEVDEVPAKERHRKGQKDYFVIVYATVQEFFRDTVQDPMQLQITIRLKPVSITNSNPYGFVILNYTEKQKAKIERAA